MSQIQIHPLNLFQHGIINECIQRNLKEIRSSAFMLTSEFIEKTDASWMTQPYGDLDDAPCASLYENYVHLL